MLWLALRGRRLGDWRFRRQHVIAVADRLFLEVYDGPRRRRSKTLSNSEVAGHGVPARASSAAAPPATPPARDREICVDPG
ncbi:MAG: hypothetical protein M3O46_03250 [Myxococcota bacterium]|nr:hypothetical protein [Myxococcota bacterium]